jgi:hypothetical protein
MDIDLNLLPFHSAESLSFSECLYQMSDSAHQHPDLLLPDLLPPDLLLPDLLPPDLLPPDLLALDQNCLVLLHLYQDEMHNYF